MIILRYEGSDHVDRRREILPILPCFVIIVSLLWSHDAHGASLLATGLSHPSNLRSYGSDLFFVDEPAGIRRVPKAGGDVETYAAVSNVHEYDYSGDVLYACYTGTSTDLISVDVPGGTPTVLPTDGLESFLGVIDGIAYYNNSSGGTNIVSVPPGFSSPVLGVIRSRIRDGGTIYYHYIDGPDIWVIDASGARRFVTLPVSPYHHDVGLVCNQDALFVSLQVGSETNYHTYRVPKSGGAAALIFSGPSSAAAADNEFVYYVQGGMVNRVPVLGGPAAAAFVVEAGTLGSLVVDESAYYWTDTSLGTGAGRIWRLGKNDSESIEWLLQTSNPGWTPRFGASSCVFGGSLWILGGHETPGASVNDVWCSANGTDWKRVTPAADWSPRTSHRSVAFNDRIWVIAGGLNEHSTYNDVWSSLDGISWVAATTSAPWASRTGHAAMVYDGSMWIMGGLDNSTSFAFSDVWKSTDGASWQCTASGAWSTRCGHSCAVYAGKMWVLGGNAPPATAYNDVWMSSDGVTWIQVTPSAQWSPRTGHTSLVWNDKLWVIGGNALSGVPLGDCWYSSTGVDWIQATSSAEWGSIGRQTCQVFREEMWALGGYDPERALFCDDVWATGIIQCDYRYAYDSIARLGRITNNQGITIPYAYDAAGNRTQKIVTSQLIVGRGPANPASRGISNNVLDEPILQVVVSASDEEDVLLKGIKFQGAGTGNDATGISAVKLWNGSDLVGASSFALDDGMVAFSGLSETIAAGTTVNLLLTYTFQGASVPAQLGDTFHVSLKDHIDIMADGSPSANHVYAVGWPVDGATLTISTDMTPPTFGGLDAANPGDSFVQLSWQAASDPSTPITYRIWQATSPFGGTVNGPPTYSTQELTCLASGLANGSTYYFVVRAEDAVGNRDLNTVERDATPVAVTHSLTTDAVHGIVSKNPDQGAYEHGTSVTLTATPEEGYRFAGWTGDVSVGLADFNPLTVVVDDGKSITANFVRAAGTVRILPSMPGVLWNVTDGDGGLHSGSGTVELPDIPTGTILCDWIPVEGYMSPGLVAATLLEGATITFEGTYVLTLAFTVPMLDMQRYVGESAEFGLAISGGLLPFQFHWKFDDGQGNIAVVGEDAPTLTIPGTTLADNGYYWCDVVDAVPTTNTSNAAHLEVADHLAFSTELPVKIESQVGDDLTMTIVLTGGFQPLSCQWYREVGKAFIPIGTDSPQLTLESLSTEDAGTYLVQVSDANADTLESSTELFVTWGVPVTSLVGLVLLALSTIGGGVAYIRRRR